MPTKDFFHDAVKIALQKDGWLILRENFRLQVDEEGLALFVDLTAQELIGATKGGCLIAVEVKSFQEPSNFYQFHAALGQYLNYRSALRELMPDYLLYLAIPFEVYQDFFQIGFIKKRIEEHALKLLIFYPDTQEIALWNT